MGLGPEVEADLLSSPWVRGSSQRGGRSGRLVGLVERARPGGGPQAGRMDQARAPPRGRPGEAARAPSAFPPAPSPQHPSPDRPYTPYSARPRPPRLAPPPSLALPFKHNSSAPPPPPTPFLPRPARPPPRPALPAPAGRREPGGWGAGALGRWGRPRADPRGEERAGTPRRKEGDARPGAGRGPVGGLKPRGRTPPRLPPRERSARPEGSHGPRHPRRSAPRAVSASRARGPEGRGGGIRARRFRLAWEVERPDGG